MSGCARVTKSDNWASPIWPPQLLWKRMAFGQLLRTAENQFTSRVRVASSFKFHSSPSCVATSWLRNEIWLVRDTPLASKPVPGMLVSSEVQRAQGNPGGGPVKTEMGPRLPLELPRKSSAV